MSRKGGLGRGLSALIPTGDSEVEESAAGLHNLELSSVHPNPLQPRKAFDEETLEGLVESIRELGVLQPILVRQTGSSFEIIAGERRWRAAKRVGLPTIPAVVRTVDDVNSLEQALVENLHRQDLNSGGRSERLDAQQADRRHGCEFARRSYDGGQWNH